MKMKYETPSAEKISFNYRDQVVAASGGDGGSGNTGGNGNGTTDRTSGDFCGGIDYVTEALGWVICDWI